MRAGCTHTSCTRRLGARARKEGCAACSAGRRARLPRTRLGHERARCRARERAGERLQAPANSPSARAARAEVRAGRRGCSGRSTAQQHAPSSRRRPPSSAALARTPAAAPARIAARARRRLHPGPAAALKTRRPPRSSRSAAPAPRRAALHPVKCGAYISCRIPAPPATHRTSQSRPRFVHIVGRRAKAGEASPAARRHGLRL